MHAAVLACILFPTTIEWGSRGAGSAASAPAALILQRNWHDVTEVVGVDAKRVWV